jgi:hypothetical protein
MSFLSKMMMMMMMMIIEKNFDLFTKKHEENK